MAFSENTSVLLAFIISFYIAGPAAEAAMALINPNAISSDINSCLFNHWMIGSSPVLASKVDCTGANRHGLCYAGSTVGAAQFAVCYNTDDLIPEFTANVVLRTPSVKTGRPNTFRQEMGSLHGKMRDH